MSRFLNVLWATRRREQSAALAERLAQYTARPRSGNVQASPVRCPVKDKRNA